MLPGMDLEEAGIHETLTTNLANTRSDIRVVTSRVIIQFRLQEKGFVAFRTGEIFDAVVPLQMLVEIFAVLEPGSTYITSERFTVGMRRQM